MAPPIHQVCLEKNSSGNPRWGSGLLKNLQVQEGELQCGNLTDFEGVWSVLRVRPVLALAEKS